MPNKPENKFAAALSRPKTTTAAEQPVEVSEKTPTSNSSIRPSRRGTKHIGGYFDPAVSKQLRKIALDEDTSVQALVAEAIDMLFQARRKPTIAKKVSV